MAGVLAVAGPLPLKAPVESTYPYRSLLVDLLYALSGYCGDVFVNRQVASWPYRITSYAVCRCLITRSLRIAANLLYIAHPT
jgi:hypothetical protein